MQIFEASKLASMRAQFPYYAAADRLRAAGNPYPVYLDSAATSQRPQQVIDAEVDFVCFKNAAVHRGSSVATGEATYLFETAREKVAAFLGCGSDYSLVWQSGATGALNTLAYALQDASLAASSGLPLGVPGSDTLALKPGDEIVVPVSEHHANLLPWQRLAARCGLRLKTIPVNAQGLWSLSDLAAAVTKKTRLVAFAHVSNVTGFTVPVAEAVEIIKRNSAKQALTVLDACQSVAHAPFNISELGVDFAVFSGHKMLGPNGIGGLVGKTRLLNMLPPGPVGGSAITLVTADSAEFLPAPQRFEPGTQPVSQAVALAAACDYLTALDMRRVSAHEQALLNDLVTQLQQIPEVTLLGAGDPNGYAGLVSLTVAGIHPHDVGQVLDSSNVSVRVGHHCAQPLHRALGITASVRASVGPATTPAETTAFVAGLKQAITYFGGK